MTEQLFETVGDILRQNPQLPGEDRAAPGPAQPVQPARLDGAPEFPTPGIYFGMDESAYHAIHAFSASGAKKLSTSSMDYWASSPINPDRENDDTVFKSLGRAYHVRICEGTEAFARRYVIELDARDFPDALHTIKQIRAAIEEAGEKPKGTKKEDVAGQLLTISPDAQIWERMVALHAKANAGREMISARFHRQIEIAARMIESDPELRRAFKDGHAEVAVFWYDEKTGCPCKSKIDFLKLLAIVDLKSFSNSQGRPISRAIDFTIASQKHYIGVMFYREAVAAAKRMIRERGASAVAINPFASAEDREATVAWALKLAQQQEAPTALWVYQQTGAAPVTRGRIHPIGTVATVTDGAVQMMKRRYVECTLTYGTDPWLDLAPIAQTTDEDIPLSATDL